MEELGADDEDPGPGGGILEDIRDVFQVHITVSVAFGVRDVGPDPTHRTGPDKFSAQGHAADHQEVAKVAEGGGLGVSTNVIRYGGGGI